MANPHELPVNYAMNASEPTGSRDRHRARIPLLLVLIPLVSLVLLIITIYIGNALSERERDGSSDSPQQNESRSPNFPD